MGAEEVVWDGGERGLVLLEDLCVRVSAREGGAEGTIRVCERRCRDINFSHYFNF